MYYIKLNKKIINLKVRTKRQAVKTFNVCVDVFNKLDIEDNLTIELRKVKQVSAPLLCREEIRKRGAW